MNNHRRTIDLYRVELMFVLAAAICIALPCSAPSLAQSPYDSRHYLATGYMAPGNAADAYRMAHPALNNHVQPVRMLVPDETLIGMGVASGFAESYSSQITVGMMVGPVYRFKISNVRLHPGVELYPSVEILGKLNPPPGLENQFPIEIQITQDDLEQAMKGRMVTRVIYLEDPNLPLPHRHVEGKQPSVEVGGGTDPLRAAERLGRPMAIMRIGSRIPTNNQSDVGFGFHAPAPVVLPAAPMAADRFTAPQVDVENVNQPNQ